MEDVQREVVQASRDAHPAHDVRVRPTVRRSSSVRKSGIWLVLVWLGLGLLWLLLVFVELGLGWGVSELVLDLTVGSFGGEDQIQGG